MRFYFAKSLQKHIFRVNHEAKYNTNTIKNKQTQVLAKQLILGNADSALTQLKVLILFCERQ